MPRARHPLYVPEIQGGAAQRRNPPLPFDFPFPFASFPFPFLSSTFLFFSGAAPGITLKKESMRFYRVGRAASARTCVRVCVGWSLK